MIYQSATIYQPHKRDLYDRFHCCLIRFLLDMCPQNVLLETCLRDISPTHVSEIFLQDAFTENVFTGYKNVFSENICRDMCRILISGTCVLVCSGFQSILGVLNYIDMHHVHNLLCYTHTYSTLTYVYSYFAQ